MNPISPLGPGAWAEQPLFDVGDPLIDELDEREASWDRWTFRRLCADLALTRGLHRKDPRRKKAVDAAKKFLDSGGLDRI